MPYAYGKSIINIWNLQYEISDTQNRGALPRPGLGGPGYSYATATSITELILKILNNGYYIQQLVHGLSLILSFWKPSSRRRDLDYSLAVLYLW